MTILNNPKQTELKEKTNIHEECHGKLDEIRPEQLAKMWNVVITENGWKRQCDESQVVESQDIAVIRTFTCLVFWYYWNADSEDFIEDIKQNNVT